MFDFGCLNVLILEVGKLSFRQVILTDKYSQISPAGDSEDETGRQAQERLVREVWKRVENLGYERPGA